MPLRRLIVVCALVSSCPVQAADREALREASTQAAPIAPWSPAAIDAPAPRLEVGDRAPRFSYLDAQGDWREVAELFAKGPVLLVFGATSEEIEALEKTRAAFLELGVSPAMVVDRRAGSTARMVKRLRLETPIIRDPVRAIAGLYGSLDRASRQHAPGYYLVDQDRIIRAAGHGALPPATRILHESARALGRPIPESAWAPNS